MSPSKVRGATGALGVTMTGGTIARGEGAVTIASGIDGMEGEGLGEGFVEGANLEIAPLFRAPGGT